MAKPKFNYNNPDFYKEIETLAMQGLTDAQIAINLQDKFDQALTQEVFSRMKNGKYEGWNEEQNKLRSILISQALAHGRTKINAIVRGAYLKSALGGKKIKSKSTVTRKIKTPDGSFEDVGEVQVTETEQELPPNMQALSTWLFNHDEEWKKSVIEGKKLDITSGGQNIAPAFKIEVIDRREQVITETEEETETP